MHAGTERTVPSFAAFALLHRPKLHGGFYDHFGVRWWDDTPTRRYDSVTDFNDRRGVAPVSYSEFAAGRPVTVVIASVPLPGRPDVAHRLSLFHVFRFGDSAKIEMDFDTLSANCEHFARYVMTNKWHSEQIEQSKLAQVVLLGKRIFGSRFPDPLPPSGAGHPLDY